jgi:cGMP-dependent protein kinase
VKVIDFGVATNLIDKDSTRTFIGTIHYMAPEMLNGKDYSFSIDIWAIGVIVYEVFYGHLPFGIDLQDPNEILNDIRERRVILPYDPKNAEVNKAIKNLLHKKSIKRFAMFNKWKEWGMFAEFNFQAVLHMQMESPLLEKGNVDLFKINNQQCVSENELENDAYPFSNFIKNNMVATENNVVDGDITGKHLCLDGFSDF